LNQLPRLPIISVGSGNGTLEWVIRRNGFDITCVDPNPWFFNPRPTGTRRYIQPHARHVRELPPHLTSNCIVLLPWTYPGDMESYDMEAVRLLDPRYVISVSSMESQGRIMIDNREIVRSKEQAQFICYAGSVGFHCWNGVRKYILGITPNKIYEKIVDVDITHKYCLYKRRFEIFERTEQIVALSTIDDQQSVIQDNLAKQDTYNNIYHDNADTWDYEKDVSLIMLQAMHDLNKPCVNPCTWEEVVDIRCTVECGVMHIVEPLIMNFCNPTVEATVETTKSENTVEYNTEDHNVAKEMLHKLDIFLENERQNKKTCRPSL
jgi:hypothetical protein